MSVDNFFLFLFIVSQILEATKGRKVERGEGDQELTEIKFGSIIMQSLKSVCLFASAYFFMFQI